MPKKVKPFDKNNLYFFFAGAMFNLALLVMNIMYLCMKEDAGPEAAIGIAIAAIGVAAFVAAFVAGMDKIKVKQKYTKSKE